MPDVPHGDYKKDYGTKYLQALAARFKPDDRHPWTKVATAYADRQEAMAKGLEAQGFQTECLKLHTAGRFLVGMGYKNALEVGLTFHHTGGFPYLPGTAVKGLCRAWAEQGVETKTPPETLRRVFGTATKGEHAEAGQMITGAVRFFDALPLGFPKLEADLMNPHYGDYYSDEKGETAPGDWLSPVPIPFLTVAAGQPFRFLLASRDSAALTDAKTWLKAAVKDLGAGGKTAAGYGYFTDPQDAVRAEQQRRKEAMKGIRDERYPDEIKEHDWVETIKKTDQRVVAEVVDNKANPVQVKLYVRDLEGQPFPCQGGIRRREDVPPGKLLWVSVQWSAKKGITALSSKGPYSPSKP